jgi:integrase
MAKYKKNKRGEWETLVWDGSYNKDGSKHRKHMVSKKSSKDLEDQVNSFIAERDNGNVTALSRYTFCQYAEHWLSVSKASSSVNTRKMYSNCVKNHLSFLDDLPLQDFTHSHFQQAINLQIEHPRTCKIIYQTVSQIIKTARRDRLISRMAADDILEDITLPKYSKPPKRALTDIEKQAVLSADLDPRKRAFLDLLYYCGIRRGEALALTAFDFDWNANTVSITKDLIFDENGNPQIKPMPKSERGIRKVPIPAACRDSLRDYIKSCGDEQLFHSKNNRYMTDKGYRRMWEYILKALSTAASRPLDLTAHTFRHNYCTELCYQIPKISTRKIAELLGDSERMVLDVYAHIMEEKEDVSGALEDIFSQDVRNLYAKDAEKPENRALTS